jgi:hypothetical protein
MLCLLAIRRPPVQHRICPLTAASENGSAVQLLVMLPKLEQDTVIERVIAGMERNAAKGKRKGVARPDPAACRPQGHPDRGGHRLQSLRAAAPRPPQAAGLSAEVDGQVDSYGTEITASWLVLVTYPAWVRFADLARESQCGACPMSTSSPCGGFPRWTVCVPSRR